MSGRYDEPRAHELRERYHAAFGGEELPVPVESIAEDLLGLAVEARELDVSGMLLPAERRILVNADEPETRRRFTIAHELGHWICQCVGATSPQPVYCRAEQIGIHPEAKVLEREANIFAAELLLPAEPIRRLWEETASTTSVPEVIDKIAERHGVSPTAAWWRAYSFGLVATGPAS
jgi:Zn-dependent peptidase ImmA (M78 family)